MKFSPDCARDIMLAVEALEPNEVLTVPKLAEMYPDYSEDVLNLLVSKTMIHLQTK